MKYNVYPDFTLSFDDVVTLRTHLYLKAQRLIYDAQYASQMMRPFTYKDIKTEYEEIITMLITIPALQRLTSVEDVSTPFPPYCEDDDVNDDDVPFFGNEMEKTGTENDFPF